MSQVARLFTQGRSQAVCLPAAFRFTGKEVYIRQDPHTGDVILSRKPATWKDFFAALEGVDVPAGFLDAARRNQDNWSHPGCRDNHRDNYQDNRGNYQDSRNHRSAQGAQAREPFAQRRA